jgi:hypothetical protein
MEEIPVCPVCHIAVRPTDYFCFNCGKNLHPKPLVLTPGKIASQFVGTLMLPPVGIIWGIRYLREPDRKIRAFGIALMITTVAELIMLVIYTISTFNYINSQVNNQVQNFMQF